MPKKYDLRRRERKDSFARGQSERVSPRAGRNVDVKPETPAVQGGYRAGHGVVIAICGLLVLSTLVVFVQTAGHDFVNCDDNEYVYDNTYIQRGLTAKCAWWAITEAHSANWHPLTWMSHAIDWQLFGRWDPELDRYVKSRPGGHHLVNLMLHALCTVLLFLTLQAMTGATWPSATVAALFAVHPLHVESVAWATGRKDTLSTLFFILTLASYKAYAVRPFSWWRYSLVVVSFALGLVSKPMLVTVPFVLLLLDYWPLGRLPAAPPLAACYVRIVLEKLPLLALSVGSCRLTTWAQSTVGAFKPLDFQYRVYNALISYAAFIAQMIWPSGMVVQYVHKGPSLRFTDSLLPLEILLPITLAAVLFGWWRRYLFVGWFWYVGMLVPVVGLVQVGAQARADRYTYLTQIGLYIMIAWGLKDLARYWRSLTAVYAAAGAIVIAALTFVAWTQTTHWRDSLALWGHSVACQPENDFAQNSYGDALNAAGRTDEANEHYRLSFEINPKYMTPYSNLAGNLYKHGKSTEAVQVCDEALKVNPDDAKVHFLRAVALYGSRQVDAAIQEFRVAIAKNPNTENTRADLADSHTDLAVVLKEQKQFDEAKKECLAGLALKPESPDALRTLGEIFLSQGDPAGAEKQFRNALKFKPEDGLSQQGLANALWKQGKEHEAIELYKRPDFQPQNLASGLEVVRTLIADPHPEAHADAVVIARRLCERTEYKNIFALELLAGAYAATGDFAQAEAAIRKALETPLGQQPSNAAVLQQRIEFYREHKNVPIPTSKL
jgi:tetratricopeptide (TPR) repeat protein